MKNILYKTSLIVLLALPLPGLAQSNSYTEKLKKNIALFESAKSGADFVKAANGFDAVTKTNKTDWLPFYYAGVCDVLAAFTKPKTEIDNLCDKAELFARMADSLSPNNSEILVLKSMIAAARISVNQTKRGQKYGIMATKFANEAIKLDASNPRAHFVKAQAILYTPAVFGGGEKKAKPVFELAIDKAKTFKQETPLHPKWGKEEAEKELKQLNNKK